MCVCARVCVCVCVCVCERERERERRERERESMANHCPEREDITSYSLPWLGDYRRRFSFLMILDSETGGLQWDYAPFYVQLFSIILVLIWLSFMETSCFVGRNSLLLS